MVLNCVAYGCNVVHDARSKISFHVFSMVITVSCHRDTDKEIKKRPHCIINNHISIVKRVPTVSVFLNGE
ncbi:hypothetical protein JTB14_015066 [Gonioctena quinquepunctata]|nr:hypothetical protein JTB14_015066 [Gonioctena quinquepunctata]